ncbi:hypothetical protein BCR34DRAFT_492642 [Clohesyomyces aquaticus]|uniref:Uncharacterized protein n=1 Tax=Clohesyomyces aquaticus TaxID=1231657 RepID=A0A1Y1YYV0_9PLEO|nr:hypothetical protein BCR34DRAFT_492642 [Clohesyomyces aquaticus]
MTDPAVTKACSFAMANHAEGDVRVFGDAAGDDDGLWKSVEKPLLMKDVTVTHIWSMKDGTKDPDDHPDGDLKAGGNSLPTKALNILGQYVPGAKTFDWLFLETDYGHGVECRTDFLIPFKTVPWATDGTVTYPGGTWDLVINEQPCQYKNSGDNAGKLFCGDKEHWCMDDPAEKNEYQCPGGYTRQPVFTCPY